MPARCQLDLPDRYLAEVRAILRQYVPDYEVWAYGSRVTGGAYAASDLDLVVRNPRDLQQPCAQIFALAEAFIESDLPIRVDVMDWALIPASFQREIERGYVVVQESSQIGLKADTQS
ncbi:nucleotidyltransferase family protein [Chloroflexus sp.]|uniref:nucleotidyltransferase family protein n=1 Tax=Chloroflexus sp. TaxID=1904827 RepID=UPI003A100682